MNNCKVTSLHVYPIKSMGEVDLSKVFAGERGFEGDRRMVLVDHNNITITQREYPELVLFDISSTSIPITITYRPTGETIQVSHFDGNRVEVTVFGDIVRATTAGKDINSWISDRIGAAVRLMKMEDSDIRMIDSVFGTSEVSFADGFPYLLTNVNSLNDLNSRLQDPVGMNRFRPNIVVDGLEPYMEDNFERIRIGEAEFKKTKPCDRCILTTVDPETGKKGFEPLQTLSTYRRINNNVYFGINLICTKNGMVESGQRVELL